MLAANCLMLTFRMQPRRWILNGGTQGAGAGSWAMRVHAGSLLQCMSTAQASGNKLAKGQLVCCTSRMTYRHGPEVELAEHSAQPAAQPQHVLLWLTGFEFLLPTLTATLPDHGHS